MRLFLIVLISLIVACNTKQSGETSLHASTDSTQTFKEETIIQETGSTNKTIEPDSEKIKLNEATIAQFPFAISENRIGITLISFLENGKVSIHNNSNNEGNVGNWNLSASHIQFVFDQDSILFRVQSFTKDMLVITTTNKLAEKLLSVQRFDYGDYSGHYFITLHRCIYIAPFPKDKIARYWQVSFGACDFDGNGRFDYSEADCGLMGSWEFDGSEINIHLPEDDCGWSTYVGNKLRVHRLSAGLMITINTDGKMTAFEFR
jgi:hypothetical protein